MQAGKKKKEGYYRVNRGKGGDLSKPAREHYIIRKSPLWSSRQVSQQTKSEMKKEKES